MAKWRLDKTFVSRRGTPCGIVDAIFEERVRRNLSLPVISFTYTIIAGVSFLNDDGTKRLTAINHCEYAEVLEMETTLRFPDGITVKKQNGEQLGWIESGLARTMVADVRRIGKPVWVCMFLRHTYNPRTGRLAGAVVAILRLDENRL